MSADTGGNLTLHGYWIDQLLSGGVTVRLLTTAVAYGDTDADLSTKEVSATGYSSQSVAATEWSTTTDATAGTTTLTNSSVIDFGTAGADWGAIVDFVIQNTTNPDRFIRVNEPNDPQVTQGEDVQFSSNDISYTLGN